MSGTKQKGIRSIPAGDSHGFARIARRDQTRRRLFTRTLKYSAARSGDGGH